MRKIYLLVTVVIIAALAAYVALRTSTSPTLTIKPELITITTSQAAIAWLSQNEYKGRILYKSAATNTPPLSAAETFGASKQHEIIITGLSPSTRYTYWLDGSDSRFQFQTQPLPNIPFSFIILWGDISKRILPLMMSEDPEFIISLTSTFEKDTDAFADVRPFVPVYNLRGPDSPFLRTVQGERAANLTATWNLDWGGLRLIFINQHADITKLLKTPTAHTLGIITSQKIVEAFKNEKPSETDIRTNKLHHRLVAYNNHKPPHPVACVAVISIANQSIEIDGIRYFTIPAQKIGDSGALRIDVDVESTRAFFIDRQTEIALREPPLKQKRTCQQCRRLADKGAYEQSIQAYKDFIKSHQGHFQIDDAYFAIAEILDEKLFSFDQALKWYRRLVKEYPDGTLTPLAKQRIKYLSAYSDYDYKPLADFERIRKIEFARKKHSPEGREKLLKQTEAIINKYPKSNIAPGIQYWLANQYRQTNPDKAVSAYLTLREKYPDHPDAAEVLMEVGETYYLAARYKEAINTYNQALAELPQLDDTINAQIARAKRNLRRDYIAWFSWAVSALIIILTVLTKPFGIVKLKIVQPIIAFLILSMLLAFGAWTIHEQFSSVTETLAIALLFSAIATIASVLSVSFTEKIVEKSALTLPNNILSAVTGTVIGLIFLCAGIYLTLYYINTHYLIVVGI